MKIVAGLLLLSIILFSSHSVKADESITIPIAEVGDDAFENNSGANYNVGGTSVTVQSTTTVTAKFNAGFRFQDINIPHGSVISSASIHFDVVSGGNGTTFTIYGQDVDSGGAPVQGFSAAWVRTSASVGPNSIPSTPSTYTTPDLTNILQEIIDRPGWVSGNDVSFLFFSATSPAAGIAFASIGSPTRDPGELTINFTAVPTVESEDATDITGTTATGNGTITNTGGENNDERGFVWGVSSLDNPGNVSPESSDYSSSLDESGSFSAESFTGSLTALDINTTYYYRAYSHNSLGYSYSEEVSFTTLNSTLSEFLQGMIVSAGIIYFIVFLVASIKILGFEPESLFIIAVVGFTLIIVYLNLDLV